MAPIAARKSRLVLQNTARVVACELVAAAQAVEFRVAAGGGAAKAGPGAGATALLAAVRSRVPHVDEDRPLGDAIEALSHEILGGAFDPVLLPHLGEGVRA